MAFEQNLVSKVVWPWTDPQPDATTKPHEKNWLQGTIVLCVAALVRWGLHASAMSAVVAGVGLVLLVTGLFAPPVFHAIDRFMKRLGRWVGGVTTWILLVPFFYLVFFPARIALLLRKRDPMQRQFPAPVASCWQSHERKPSNYARQF